MNNSSIDNCVWSTAVEQAFLTLRATDAAVHKAALFFGMIGFILNVVVTRGLFSSYSDRQAARTKVTLDLNLSLTDTGCCLYSVLSAISALAVAFPSDSTIARVRRALDYIVQIAPAVNYTGLFVLQFLQFSHPLTWKQKFTRERCLWIILGQWVAIAVTVPLVTLKLCLSDIDSPGYAETGLSLRAIRTAVYCIKLLAVSLGASALVYAYCTKMDIYLAAYGRKKQNLAVRIALFNVGILFCAILLTLCADLAQWPYYYHNFRNSMELVELERTTHLPQSVRIARENLLACEAYRGIYESIKFYKLELLVNLVWIVRMSSDPIGQIIRDRDIVKSQFSCRGRVKRSGGVRGGHPVKEMEKENGEVQLIHEKAMETAIELAKKTTEIEKNLTEMAKNAEEQSNTKTEDKDAAICEIATCV